MNDNGGLDEIGGGCASAGAKGNVPPNIGFDAPNGGALTVIASPIS